MKIISLDFNLIIKDNYYWKVNSNNDHSSLLLNDSSNHDFILIIMLNLFSSD